MKTVENRHRRQESPRATPAPAPAAARRPRRLVAALLAGAALVFAAAPAATQAAGTGGATTLAADKARSGQLGAFTPMRWAGATWYGPGLYGNRTACGQVLRPRTMGVAHRTLPCGTTVKFVHRGRRAVTRVIDRGPYTHGNDWDLTYAVARALAFERVGVARIGFAISLKDARKARAARRARG